MYSYQHLNGADKRSCRIGKIYKDFNLILRRRIEWGSEHNAAGANAHTQPAGNDDSRSNESQPVGVVRGWYQATPYFPPLRTLRGGICALRVCARLWVSLSLSLSLCLSRSLSLSPLSLPLLFFFFFPLSPSRTRAHAQVHRNNRGAMEAHMIL